MAMVGMLDNLAVCRDTLILGKTVNKVDEGSTLRDTSNVPAISVVMREPRKTFPRVVAAWLPPEPAATRCDATWRKRPPCVSTCSGSFHVIFVLAAAKMIPPKRCHNK
ncbi:hypothetical protein MRX96_039388 [Rhipicephalus microplus]